MMGCCLFVHHRKKRKQASGDADGLSLCSLDINEPSTKRSKPVSRVASLASLLPPVKTTPLKRISQTLQRSITFRNESRAERTTPPPPPSATMKTRIIATTLSSPSSSLTASRVSIATCPTSKRRDSKLWSETFDVRLGATQPLSPKEIKRQEAIFELTQGEQDLVEDLKLAKKAYRDPMLKLSIMTEQELNQIFGTLDSLIPLHEDLLSRLRDARKPNGSTDHVGHILTNWLPCLSSYTPYCSNQVQAKALLDQKKQDRRVQDFLQRCLQSPFSRKLDLWNFLDIPRSRLVKYPLLLREILKHTANDHPDRQHLEEAVLMVQSEVADINRQIGESECRYYKDRLLFSEEVQRDGLIDRSKTISCHGELKNHRGLKLHVFLFQDVLVITRSMSLNNQPISYQLCRQPIPIRHLELEDLTDGEMRVGGSIRGAFSNTERTKNFFRVSFRAGGQLQTHCFQASDAFNKQQWINCIRQAKEAAELTGGQPPERGPAPEPGPGPQKDQTLIEASGLEKEKSMWGQAEACLMVGEELTTGEVEACLMVGEELKTGEVEACLMVGEELTTGEVEACLMVGEELTTGEVEACLMVGEELKTGEVEACLMVGEELTMGEVEAGAGVSAEECSELDELPDGVEMDMRQEQCKMDGGGEPLVSGDDNGPGSAFKQGEEELMKEEEEGSREEEQVNMDTEECREQNQRC